MNDGKTVKCSVNFSEPVYQLLKALAERRGGTMTDVLRDAIGLYEWVDRERASGGRIIAEKNGEFRELVFL